MITEEQEHFMQITTDMFQYTKTSGLYGAIVVKNGNIIGTSENFLIKEADPCGHSEVVAVRDACRNLKSLDLSGCNLYSLTEPCPMCMAAIYWAQLSNVTYFETKNGINFSGSGKLIYDNLNIKTLEISPPRTHRTPERDNSPKKPQSYFIGQVE